MALGRPPGYSLRANPAAFSLPPEQMGHQNVTPVPPAPTGAPTGGGPFGSLGGVNGLNGGSPLPQLGTFGGLNGGVAFSPYTNFQLPATPPVVSNPNPSTFTGPMGGGMYGAGDSFVSSGLGQYTNSPMVQNPASSVAANYLPPAQSEAVQQMQGFQPPIPDTAEFKAPEVPGQNREQPGTVPATLGNTSVPNAMTQEQIIAAMQGYNPQAQTAGMNTYTNSLANNSTPDQFANNAYSQAAFDSVAADINKQYDLARTRKIQDLMNRGMTNYSEGNPGHEINMLEQERQQALAKARTDIQTSALQNMYQNYFQQQGLDMNRGSLGLQGSTQMAGLGLNAASLGQQGLNSAFNNNMAVQNLGLDTQKFQAEHALNDYLAQEAARQNQVNNNNKQIEYDLMRRQLQAGKDGGLAGFLGHVAGTVVDTMPFWGLGGSK